MMSRGLSLLTLTMAWDSDSRPKVTIVVVNGWRRTEHHNWYSSDQWSRTHPQRGLQVRGDRSPGTPSHFFTLKSCPHHGGTVVIDCWQHTSTMSVSELEILLERTNRVYYAGEVVRGTIAIVTTGYLNCRGFYMRLQGRARVHWHQGARTGEMSNRRDYFGSTIFQSQRHTLIGRFHKTALLDEAGADADFDVVPNSGVFANSLRFRRASGREI